MYGCEVWSFEKLYVEISMEILTCLSVLSVTSVLGKCSNEMVALHLLKTYCLTTLMYGCEVWSLTNNSLHKVNVAWNNCFRRIFS